MALSASAVSEGLVLSSQVPVKRLVRKNYRSLASTVMSSAVIAKPVLMEISRKVKS